MSTSDENSADIASSIPQAVIATSEQVGQARLKTRLWWLTGLCVVLAIGLIATNFRGQGSVITISFDDGYGLKVGDSLRYRGIEVGRVYGVTLAPDLASVQVQVILGRGNESIAVEGSQFWIERARLRIGEVRGLETVLGAHYISVIPGDPASSTRRKFNGLETPLAINTGDAQDIMIHFPAGEGLQIGDMVQYRGIRVGEVTGVELSEQADGVVVRVRLVGAARKFARAGTQFWIERPRLDLTEVRGLDTLLAGRYITLQPGSAKADAQLHFTGLSHPPPMPRRDGSLEIELDAPRRLGLVRGAPITYRGLEVGYVAAVGLSQDGASVKVAAVVDPEYAELVRANSKWWVVGGMQVEAGLRGIQVSMESLSAVIRGGIAFATPVDAGERVVTGHRFMLEPQPQREWLDWQPRIAVGNVGRIANGSLPTPIRVVASWQTSWLGLFRRRTVESWGLALDDGLLYVPTQFVDSAKAAGAQVNIELAGKSWAFDSTTLASSEASALPPTTAIPIPSDVALARWPRGELSQVGEASNPLLVINPELSEPMAIDPTRVEVIADGHLRIAPGVPIAKALAGSPVIDAANSRVLGILVQRNDRWLVARLPGH
jgi:paraquat-inducible protein B